MGKGQEISSNLSDNAGHAIRVVAGFVFCSGKILITQRLATDAWGGYWEFPGGKVEPGESDAQALERELFEEVGLRTTTGSLAWELTHEYSARKVAVYFYYSSLLSGDPQCRQVQAFRWIPRKELSNFPFLPSNESLLRKLIDEKV